MNTLRNSCTLLLAALATATAGHANAATVIEKYLNTRGDVGFFESSLGTQTNFTDTIDRAECPAGQVLTQVEIEIFNLDIATRLQFQNPTGNVDNVLNTFTEHTALRLQLQANPVYEVGAAPIAPPNRFPPPPGGTNVFECEIAPGDTQSECFPTPLPVPMLETTYPNTSWVLTQADGVAFDYFKTPGPINVLFTAGGRVQTNVPASWQTQNETPATGNVKITYTCEVPPNLSLVCDSKTLAPAVLNGPDGVVSAAFRIRNNGNVPFVDNLQITDTMGAKMTLNSGTVSIPPGEPVGGPPTYTWSGLSLAPTEMLDVSYQATVTGLNVGETVCNTVVASANGTTSNECRACVRRPSEPPSVPAIGPLGVAVLGGSLAGLGLLFGFRRRRSH